MMMMMMMYVLLNRNSLWNSEFSLGVPVGETDVTCTAGGGTLSRLNGDPIYERAALRALPSL